MEHGSTKILKREQQKLGNGARSERNYQGARRKIKKEQGARRDEKGALKIGNKERVPQNGKEHGESGIKCQRDQGA